jgi:TPR repeat protein
MSGLVLRHRHRSAEDLQLLLARYKIRDALLKLNDVKQDIKKALELASVCALPNAVWLTKLFAGRDVASREQARQVFLGFENDDRADELFALLVCLHKDVEIRRAADLDDSLAQARMAWEDGGEERFWWAEKSAAQRERDGFYQLGICYRGGIGCEEGVERAKEHFLVAAELGYVYAMVCFGELPLLDKNDPNDFFGLRELLQVGSLFIF